MRASRALYDCSPDDARGQCAWRRPRKPTVRVVPGRSRRVPRLGGCIRWWRASLAPHRSPGTGRDHPGRGGRHLECVLVHGLSYARILRLGLESTHARELSVNPGYRRRSGTAGGGRRFDLARGDIDSAGRSGRRALGLLYVDSGRRSRFHEAGQGAARAGVVLSGRLWRRARYLRAAVEAAARIEPPAMFTAWEVSFRWQRC